jgi:hypothetical protein
VVVRRALALAGVAVTAATATAALAVRDADRLSPVAIAVDAAHPGRAVPSSFVGFSMEVPAVAAYAGSAARPNRALPRLLATLDGAQGSPVALRIGGNSGDESWWGPGTANLGPRSRRERYLVKSREVV